MTLSEAIRLGALLKPQGFGSWGFKTSCALRAATDAVGDSRLDDGMVDYDALIERWPFLLDRVPTPTGTSLPLVAEFLATIYFLNDTEAWTRERIAAWVATLEPTDTGEGAAPSWTPSSTAAASS